MKKHDVETIITEYMKPIFGFTLKRCKNIHDAEDLSQEIVMKIFRSLLKRDDIEDIGKFVWTVAHNSLSNYYRDGGNRFIGVSFDEIPEICFNGDSDICSDFELKEISEKLHKEIAYLSKLQRRIVISYYYENKKQNEISEELGIPVGTVKWHLFEAKKDLKRGMQKMRKTSELKFNPIEFALCGTNGLVGDNGSNQNYFRNALSQNIEYAVWKEPKTVNEIADLLGVSPVYVESEAEYLEKYGFLTKHSDKYLCNILLEERSSELNRLQSEVYEKAAKIFANELYDALISSDIWDNPDIIGGYSGKISFTEEYAEDKNFLLWSIVPYIAYCSGESLIDSEVSFEEAATFRPDGGHNLCYASVLSPEAVLPKYFDSMLSFCGACQNKVEDISLWQIDTEWSGLRIGGSYPQEVRRTLTLIRYFLDGKDLREDEYAYLAELGFLKCLGNAGKKFKVSLQCILINGNEAKRTLISIGDRIKEKYSKEFGILRKTYADAVLGETPKHLHIMQKYNMQSVFFADSWFILHCLKELVNNGKLRLPTEDQKKKITRIIIRD